MKHRALVAAVLMVPVLVGIIVAQRPQDIPDLQRTDEIVLHGTVSSVFVTNYHVVLDWTNGVAPFRTTFETTLEEPPDMVGAKIEGVRKQNTREVKEIPTLRFSWMGQMHEITATNVMHVETNQEVLRFVDGEKEWKWIPERDDDTARQPAGAAR